MADQNSSLLSHAESRRDSYGFAVRPQHLHRYREYGNIYKEEEEERSEKWTNFLGQCSNSTHPCIQDEEPLGTSKADDTTAKIDSTLENLVEGDALSGENSASVDCTDGDVKKEAQLTKEEKRHNIKTWAPIRSTLSPIEKMMSVRVRNNVLMSNDQVQLLHRLLPPLPPTGKVMLARKNVGKNIEEKLQSDESAPDSNCVDLEVSASPAESNCTAGDSNETSEISDMKSHEADIPLNSLHIDAILNDSSQKTEAGVHQTENGLESTIGNLVDNESFFPWKQELESLVHGGVPKSLRGEVWQAFVGVRVRRVEKYYQDLLSMHMDSLDSKTESAVAGDTFTGCAPEKWRKQIEKDLPRTFPGHPALDEEGRNSLRRILVAYARHNPSVGYCQAMNFFAGLLLLLMPEENAFWMLVGIIDDYFDGYYTHEMIESQVDQLVFEELMRERFPKLVNHLDYLGVEVAWVSGPWFLSIFVNMLPWESVLRVWDVILYEGNRVMLFRTALALMELYGPALVTTKDAADAVSLLQSLTGSTFDSSQLVFTACMGFLAVTESRLEELRGKHRPSVLGIIDDRTKGTEVSKDSKSLASKLYSFKQEAQSLIKEPNTYRGLSGKLNDSGRCEANSSPDNFDEFMSALNVDSEVDVAKDHQEQVVWLKVELCRLMEEQRLATLRAEELETAFLEMVKQDNRRELSARVEQLEQEVIQLRQALSDKQEQESAMLQVLMRVEQEQKVTEDARIAAEQEAAAQKNATHVLQEKYEKAIASLAEMEKRVVMAESMLQATLQYESGQAKALTSPRSPRADSPRTGRRTGLLSFGLGWRDKNKERPPNERRQGEHRLTGKNNPEDDTVA